MNSYSDSFPATLILNDEEISAEIFFSYIPGQKQTLIDPGWEPYTEIDEITVGGKPVKFTGEIIEQAEKAIKNHLEKMAEP